MTPPFFEGGGGSNKKKPYVWFYVPKERIVTLIVVTGCEGPSTMVRTQHTLFCRESRFVASYTRAEGGGGSQKVTNDDEGEGGGTIPPKIDDVIYEQPLKTMGVNKYWKCEQIDSKCEQYDSTLYEQIL